MVSTRFGLKCETPFEGSNLPPSTMTDTDTFQQLQTRISEIEQHNEEELRKLKADHDYSQTIYAKKNPSSMDKLQERAKGYIQIEEISRLRNEVQQAGQKRDKREGVTKIDSHKSDKRHKSYNCITILEEFFNAEVPIKLPPPLPCKLGLDKTKYYRYHHRYGYNIEDCWALKDKIEELIQAGYLAQFVKRTNIHSARARHGGHQEDQHRNQDVDRRRDRVEDRGRQRLYQQKREL
ncbi:hypothetical protein JHK86_022596 [Glycine max]|nr:hypothetical protein JHK86_022596 [Glycine max]